MIKVIDNGNTMFLKDLDDLLAYLKVEHNINLKSLNLIEKESLDTYFKKCSQEVDDIFVEVFRLRKRLGRINSKLDNEEEIKI